MESAVSSTEAAGILHTAMPIRAESTERLAAASWAVELKCKLFFGAAQTRGVNSSYLI